MSAPNERTVICGQCYDEVPEDEAVHDRFTEMWWCFNCCDTEGES